MSSPFFCSYDPAFRDPVGAVPSDTAIRFRVRAPRNWHVSGVSLRVTGDDIYPIFNHLLWSGMDDPEHEWWECHWTPPSVGLYYYTFIVQTPDGPSTLTRGYEGCAYVKSGLHSAPGWQLTAYDPSFTTPDWLAGGVMYQIFPDRFAASGHPKKGVPADRVMHTCWGESPCWEADSLGKIRNNDFFGGDLAGITAHLDRLEQLGVTCLYLNPIFESHSNHRYDTADYDKVDPLLGDEGDLKRLCKAAAKRGIRILLDGVFSHTGSDSRYFNRSGRYDAVGAYQSLSSPYASWYNFRRWPSDYVSWWGFETLPEVNETDPAYLEYITGEHGVLRRWLRCGVSGWRLDVADELPDRFLDALRVAIKAEKEDGLILGEVWEDASNKSSYGRRRRYLLGKQLDSVMNYPFRKAILDFLRGGRSEDFHEIVLGIVENYPPPVLRLLMNHIGTHDTERALTVLGGEPSGGRGRRWQAEQRLSPSARARGIARLKLAAVLQYCLPGVPCVYYGDEAGMEGYRDPFNRACYPWGQEDTDLLAWYAALGRMRKSVSALASGGYLPWHMADGLLMFERRGDEDELLCAVNRSDGEQVVTLPENWESGTLVFGTAERTKGTLRLPPVGCAILVKPKK